MSIPIWFLCSILICTCNCLQNLEVSDVVVKSHENIAIIEGLNLNSTPESIDVTDVGDLLTRMFWAGKVKDTTVFDLNSQLPSANLLVVNFGVDDSVKDIPEFNVKQEHLTNVNIGFFPADPVSILTSIITGTSPADHGVVGESWMVGDEVVEAFSAEKTFSSSVSSLDLINQHYQNEVTIGASSSILAKALSHGNFPNTYFNGVKFVSEQEQYNFTINDMINAMKKEKFWLDNKDAIGHLDLQNKNDINFLMEMEYIRRVGKNMDGSANFPLYNIATTSLRKVVEPEALKILANSLTYLKSQYSKAYPKGSSQMLFVKSPTLESGFSQYTRDFIHPKEFNENCATTVCATADATTTTEVEGRAYQFKIWILFFSFVIVLWYVQSVSSLNYESDAILFSKWKRSEGRQAFGRNREGFGH